MLLGEIPKPLPFRTQEEIMSGWLQTGDPMVSVLCATFNHVDFIEDAILGFLGQVTDFSFEVIIRDDASTDGTAEIVRSYAASHPQIIKPIFEHKNSYPGKKPFACMIGVASGKYIALCEGDDYWIDEHKLALQVSVLESDTLVSLVRTQCINIEGDQVVGINCQGGTRTYLFRSFDDYPVHRQRYIYFGDTFLSSRLHADGAVFDINKVTAVWRKHPDGVWSSLLDSDTKDTRLLDFRRGMTQFWLVEYFLTRQDRGRAREHLKKTVNVFLRAYPEVSCRTKLELVLNWLLLDRIKSFMRYLKATIRPYIR